MYFPVVIVFLLFSSVSAGTFTDTVTLSPQWYRYQSFSGINHLSLEVHETKGSGVTVYLNAGKVNNFDADSSLIHCTNVRSCSVKDLRLTTGTYTLFIYNNYYFTTQDIVYTVEYWTLRGELYLLCGLAVVVLSSCCMCYCIYRVMKSECAKNSCCQDNGYRHPADLASFTGNGKDELQVTKKTVLR